jgi:hypothetical protein
MALTPHYIPLANDKNSLQDVSTVQKRELYVKKKKSQDMGGFLKTSCEDRDKEISKWD